MDKRDLLHSIYNGMEYENLVIDDFKKAIVNYPSLSLENENNIIDKGYDFAIKKDGKIFVVGEIKWRFAIDNDFLRNDIINRNWEKSIKENAPFSIVVFRDFIFLNIFTGSELSRIFIGNNIKHAISQVLKEITSYFTSEKEKGNIIDSGQIKELKEEYFKEIDGICNWINDEATLYPNEKKDATLEVLNKIKEEIKNHNFSKSKDITLSPQLEKDLYTALLGKVEDEYICRFTTLQSIFRTCNEQTQGMVSIICMNDKGEIDGFGISNKAPDLKKGINTNTTKNNRDWNYIGILSCCRMSKYNDLTMMRLYADDSKGVTIKYKVDYQAIEKDGFQLYPVSYSIDENNHPEKELLKKLTTKNKKDGLIVLRNLNAISYFFKNNDYSVEDEIRLLYFDKGKNNLANKIWFKDDRFNIIAPLYKFDVVDKKKILNKTSYTNKIEMPLIISQITLCPNMKSKGENLIQLEELIKEKSIKYHLENPGDALIRLSPIYHYRI